MRAWLQVELTPHQQFKARWLHEWARQADLTLSHGEADEMIASGNMTPDLKDLWDRKTAEQKAVDAICAAIARQDLAAMQVRPTHSNRQNMNLYDNDHHLCLQILEIQISIHLNSKFQSVPGRIFCCHLVLHSKVAMICWTSAVLHDTLRCRLPLWV